MSAVVLFGVSGFLLYRLFLYRHFIGVNVEYPSILLLMMAIITCSIAWIGWRTTKSMHQIHVIITGLLIIIVVVIEFSCFVWAMVVWDNTEIDIKTTMTSYFAQTTAAKDPNSADAIRWDRIHVRFECCGVNGPNDYTSSGRVPLSCCGQGPLDELHKPYTSDCSALYQRGCGKPVHDYTRQQLLLVAMTALTASILQSTGIFCTFFLAHAIREKRKMSLRHSTTLREGTYAAADDSLLASPSAPAPTLPKY